jgi:serine/threonine-protein kinase RsbW
VSQQIDAHPKECRFQLVLRSILSEVSKVEPFLLKVNKKLKLDEVQFNKMFLAVSEAVTNGIIHGNKQDPKKKVKVVCECEERSVVIHVSDQGSGHDFNSLPNPLAKKNLLNENGRGIFLIRTLMDNVRFFRSDHGLEVVMRLVRHGHPKGARIPR